MKNWILCWTVFFFAAACGGHGAKAGEDGESIVVCDTDADCLNGEECNSQGVCAVPGNDGRDGTDGESIVGPKGDKGDPGDGIVTCESDSDCADDEECNSQGVCALPGEDGTDGVDGVDGTDGVDGADGKDGADGQDADNGDKCADDGDCPQGVACVNGSCIDTNCHGNDDNCLEGEMCDNDVCVPIPVDQDACNVNADCGSRQVCENSCCVDVECTLNSHCSSDEECVGNECVPVEPEPQPEPEPESEPEPQPEPEPECTSNAHCSGGDVCRLADNTCGDCTANSQCGSGKECVAGSCVTPPAATEETDEWAFEYTLPSNVQRDGVVLYVMTYRAATNTYSAFYSACDSDSPSPEQVFVQDGLSYACSFDLPEGLEVISNVVVEGSGESHFPSGQVTQWGCYGEGIGGCQSGSQSCLFDFGTLRVWKNGQLQSQDRVPNGQGGCNWE